MRITNVYTDGSAFNNQRRESAKTFGGIGAYFGENDRRNVSQPFFEFPITNNRTEIKASIKAIENFMQDKIVRKDKHKEKLIVHSDSQYMINSITIWINKWKKNRWKTANGKDVLNKDLLFSLDHLINLYRDFIVIEFKFVKAHRDIPKNRASIDYQNWYGNMMADKFAKNGSLMALKAAKI
jgi:ribonuclease HI